MTQPDPDALRIGDQERETAIAVLHDAVGGGYLDIGEFEERSSTVYAARTRGDLRAALADLPAAARLFPPPPTAVAVGVAGPAGGTETLDIEWTTRKRRGPWVVPAHLIITGAMGNADLDLRAATIPLAGCVIEVRTSWSTVKIRLDRSTVVTTQDYQGGSMSSFKDRAGPPSVPGGPVVDLRGQADWTTVVLRRD